MKPSLFVDIRGPISAGQQTLWRLLLAPALRNMGNIADAGATFCFGLAHYQI